MLLLSPLLLIVLWELSVVNCFIYFTVKHFVTVCFERRNTKKKIIIIVIDSRNLLLTAWLRPLVTTEHTSLEQDGSSCTRMLWLRFHTVEGRKCRRGSHLYWGQRFWPVKTTTRIRGSQSDGCQRMIWDSKVRFLRLTRYFCSECAVLSSLKFHLRD